MADGDLRSSSSGRLGIAVLATVATANVLLWIAARPSGEPGRRFLGELCGAEAVLLFSCALVLATLLPPIERAFGGLDRVALWHRHAAVVGVLLLIPHLALVTSPPGSLCHLVRTWPGRYRTGRPHDSSLWALAPGLRAARWPGLIRRMARATYERWLTAHRLTGLFVAAAVAHGAIVDPVLHRSVLLRVVFLSVGSLGVIAYAYRELFAHYFIPIYDYTVADVRRLNEATLDVALAPTHERLSFTPGQFVFLALGGPGGWERHPFSVSSSPDQPELELTIKASGDYTAELFDKLAPGVPAKLAGPFGGFDYRHGGDRQVWIAGGIGITPFISWIRSLDGEFDREVDFYYSVAHAGDAVYVDEIKAAADRHRSLHFSLVCADTDGLLSADKVISAVPAGAKPSVYMCGPPPMMRAFSHDLRRLGVSAGQVRWEQFGAR